MPAPRTAPSAARPPRRAALGLALLAPLAPMPARAAKPAPPPAQIDDWAPSPPTDGADPLSVAFVELQPAPEARAGGSGLGPHQPALRALPVEVCARQLAAWKGEDLAARACLDVEVSKKGKLKVDAAVVEPEVPGLARCLSTVVERYVGPRGAAAEGRLCRAIATNSTPAARAAWARDPYAEPEGAAARHPPTGLVDKPRAVPEAATRRGADGVWAPGPLGLREQPVSTALRFVEGATEAVRACAGDHASWRPWADGVDVFVDVIVNEAGVAGVVGSGASPAGFAGLSACVAARLDPRFPAGEGDVRVPVRVMVRPEAPAAP